LTVEKTDRLLSDRDLSALIGRARATIQKDRVSGRGVPFIKIGGLVRYRESDVQAYIASLATRRSTSEPEVEQ
jgi:predicted DNA-binding transcriptional regulator AlpA